MKQNTRNNTLDILRIVASFFIVYLHVTFTNANGALSDIVRLMARWAMPFFFLMSGYWFQKGLENSPSPTFKKNFTRILVVFLVTNIVYAPLIIFLHIKIRWNFFILYGGVFHLWYLPALLIGFMACYLLKILKANNLVSVSIILLVIILALFGGPYTFVINVKPHNFGIFRALLAIPLMLIGGCFYNNIWFKNRVTLSNGLILTVIGFLLQLTEAWLIKAHIDISFGEHQFLIGTLFFSVGLFIIGLSANFKSETLSVLGRDFSLFVYLYHPMFIYIFQHLKFDTIFQGNSILLFPALIFSVTLGIGLLLNRYLYALFLILNGVIKKEKPA
jgi:peptidoglycan/LPS O-acetylase OafA/YrhL